jgi:protein HOOK3
MLALLPRDAGLQANKLEQLHDGAVFSAILEVIDDQYNPARFQQALEASSAQEDLRPRNFHIIHMAFNDFARRRCPKTEPLIRSIDFQGLGRHPSRQGLSEVNFEHMA